MSAQGTASADAYSRIAGTWRGHSECVERNGPCHDEINVYRFSEISGRPGWFSGTGSKIVDGNEIAMGTMEWKYDSEKHSLQSDGAATVRLVITGKAMDGDLTLRNKTVIRRIHLEKE